MALRGVALVSVPWIEVIMSRQTEHVLHIVDAGLLGDDPLRRTERPTGKNRPVAGLVDQLDTLAQSGENNRVVADDVTAAQGMDAHLGSRARAGDAAATTDRTSRL